jgi:hypothetical protein
MRNTTILGSLMAAALLVLLLPTGTSAQFYRDRYYDRDQNEQFERGQLRNALARLDNSSARLQSDLRFSSTRRLFGIFQYSTVDTNAVEQIRDFRRAVRQLRYSSANGRMLSGSVDEAQLVLERGVQLDRYLRLRSGSSAVDADLSDIRSALHVIADTYDLRMPY